MSFPIVLQKNTSPENKMDKTITDVATATGVLKENTSLIDPVVLIDSSYSAGLLKNVNYATISEFERKYFVKDIVIVGANLWEVHMHVDVLSTYASQLRELTAVLARSETMYNMYLDDGWFMAYQNPTIEKRYFTNASPFEAEEYVLVVAGS